MGHCESSGRQLVAAVFSSICSSTSPIPPRKEHRRLALPSSHRWAGGWQGRSPQRRECNTTWAVPTRLESFTLEIINQVLRPLGKKWESGSWKNVTKHTVWVTRKSTSVSSTSRNEVTPGWGKRTLLWSCQSLFGLPAPICGVGGKHDHTCRAAYGEELSTDKEWQFFFLSNVQMSFCGGGFVSTISCHPQKEQWVPIVINRSVCPTSRDPTPHNLQGKQVTMKQEGSEVQFHTLPRPMVLKTPDKCFVFWLVSSYPHKVNFLLLPNPWNHTEHTCFISAFV